MSIVTRLLSLPLAVVLTTGWGGCGQVVKTPEVVYVEVQVPAVLTAKQKELLKDCVIEEGNDATIKELHRVASDRKLSLQLCNKDKEALRTILK